MASAQLENHSLYRQTEYGTLGKANPCKVYCVVNPNPENNQNPDPIEALCEEFEQQWEAGRSPQIEDFLERISADLRESLLRELIQTDCWWRRKQGEPPVADEYSDRFPEHADLIRVAIEAQAARDTASMPGNAPTRTRLPKDADWEGPEQGQLSPGTRLGDYELLEQIGRGGMGVVYKARHVHLEKVVALKLLTAQLADDPQALSRFEREIKALGKLEHPHIVEASDAGQDGDHWFLVMRYVEGFDLRRVIQQQGPLPIATACDYARQAALGLEHAHQQGLVHRDVKPSNLMLTPDGVVKLLDLGLASLRADPEATTLTQDHQVLGTADYMAPEQFRDAASADARADVYSLGCTLFHLLAGKAPYSGPEYSSFGTKAAAHLKEPFPDIRRFRQDLPPQLRRLLEKMVAKDPRRRFADIGEVASELGTIAEDASDGGERDVPANDSDPGSNHSGSRQTSRLLVFLFTDLIDSSRLKVELGDVEYVSYIAQPHNDLFRELLEKFPGAEESNYTGDGFLATFASVADAVNFALLFHDALRQHPWERTPATTRIGIHLGDTIEFDESVDGSRLLAGHAADMCARVMGLGAGGQTLLTRAAFDSARQYVKTHPESEDGSTHEINWLAHGRYRFKGADEPMEVFEVGAAGQAPLAPPADSEKARRVLSDEEEQTLGWRPGLGLGIPGRDGWTVTEKIGEGGFGEVWLGRQSRTKEQRVFKFCFDPERLRSFKRELTLFRLIQQELGERPDIARLLEVRVDKPPFYLESEYVAGGNLRQWADARGGIETLPLPQRVELVRKVARAVAAAHSLGIIHKDIKPSNVLIEEKPEGAAQPRLADFGIGVLTNPELLVRHDITQTGFTESLAVGNDSSRTGTRLYAPPEAQVGKPASTAGDVYALGVMLYQLVTGDLDRPLGVGWEGDVEDEFLQEDITACTLRDPERRLGGAFELAERLEHLESRAQTRESLRLAKENERRRERRAQRRRRLAIISGVIVGVTAVIICCGGFVIVHNENKGEARALVQALLTADTQNVSAIISNLHAHPFRDTATARLMHFYESADDDSDAKLHAALALVEEDDSVLAFLRDRLLRVRPEQFIPVRDLLWRQRLFERNRLSLKEHYWMVATDAEQEGALRFRAACALAHFDSENEIWNDDVFREFVAGHLVNSAPYELWVWRDALEPVGQHLAPPLEAIYRDHSSDFRSESSSFILASFLGDEPGRLFELLTDADERQINYILNELLTHRERAIELGTAEIVGRPLGDVSEDQKEMLAVRQAIAAVMLLKLDAPDQVWPLLRHSVDPRVRSYIINWLGSVGCNPLTIITRLEQETDVTIQRALLLCLGDFDEFRLPEGIRVPLIETLLAVYSTNDDRGLHAAAEWLLRRWGHSEEIAAIETGLWQSEEELQDDQGNQPEWYINRQGQTFVILDADGFWMGSPESEAGRDYDEVQHWRRIGRRFAISTKEVTRAQWRAFSQSRYVEWTADEEQLESIVRTDDSPMVAMMWYETQAYCNWLSEQEGLSEDQWCYELSDQGESGLGMKVKENFLELSGYRLPTEAEWEFACRAGAGTSRYYGQADTLLSRYAWYQANGDNHVWPSAILKPNDFGLFDMHGNALEWCHDPYQSYPIEPEETVTDAPSTDAASESVRRVLRGGSFHQPSVIVRCAYRDNDQPGYRLRTAGFRPARTYNLSH